MSNPLLSPPPFSFFLVSLRSPCASLNWLGRDGRADYSGLLGVSYVLMRRPMRTEVDNSRLLQQLRPNKTDELVIHSSSRLSGDEQREQSEVQHSPVCRDALDPTIRIRIPRIPNDLPKGCILSVFTVFRPYSTRIPEYVFQTTPQNGRIPYKIFFAPRTVFGRIVGM